jgi:TetR/AcrR family transcriptional regulator
MARDAAATQQRIIDAATDEFAAHGISGARVDEIAAKADANKRMLYYYFGSKEQLFREILRRKLAERVAEAAGSVELSRADRLAERQALHLEDSSWVRLLMWEALEYGADTELEDEVGRGEIYGQWVAATEQAQADGEVAADLDARQLVLTELALTLFPAAFPQLTRLVSGTELDDPEFLEARQTFLRRLSDRLAGP